MGDSTSPSGPNETSGPNEHSPAHGVTPEETPAGESSTTAGISVPEPEELRNAWGVWPLAVIAVMVLAVAMFMVARIFSW